MNDCILGLKLIPLDVLFFRDGRPFGEATKGKSELPVPQTLAGAMATAMLEQSGVDWTKFSERMRATGDVAAVIRELGAGRWDWIADMRVRGPWLARMTVADERQLQELEILVPAPATLQQAKSIADTSAGELLALRPVPPEQVPGWKQSLEESNDGLWPLWLSHPARTEPVSGYVTLDAMRRFLAGQTLQRTDLVPPEALFGFDQRTGIGISPDTLTAAEGMIYGASFLALRPGVFLVAEICLPDSAHRETVANIRTLTLGGEGRRVAMELLREGQPIPWPQVGPARSEQKPMLVLTTPGLFSRRWRPASLDQTLLAAAIPGSLPVSGWDLARGGPKPSRFAVPAGSVFFLRESLDPWPTTLADGLHDQAQGWGCYLKGLWNDE